MNGFARGLREIVLSLLPLLSRSLSPSLPLSFPFLLGDVSHRPSPGGLLQTLTHRRNDNRRRPRIDRIARNHRHVPDVVLLSICANVPFVFYEYLYSSLDDSCEFFPILTNKRRPLFYFSLFFSFPSFEINPFQNWLRDEWNVFSRFEKIKEKEKRKNLFA